MYFSFSDYATHFFSFNHLEYIYIFFFSPPDLCLPQKEPTQLAEPLWTDSGLKSWISVQELISNLHVKAINILESLKPCVSVKDRRISSGCVVLSAQY